MNKEDLTFAKINDKIKFCNSKNKIVHTDFFTEPEILKITNYLNSIKFKNYFFFGGCKDNNRKMLFLYPEKLTYEMAFKNIPSILKVIRITLPHHLQSEFEHRNYLSALMKFGIVREKFGDIIVYNEGADIVVQTENADYFKENLKNLTRFQKSNINIIEINNIHENNINYKEISIIVNSMRIDNFVSELAHCSRSKAEEILLNERVMVNYEITLKNSKNININDIITIRGFGRFIVKEISGKTKSDKLVVKLFSNE